MIRSHELQGYGAFKYSSAFYYRNPLSEKPISVGLEDVNFTVWGFQIRELARSPKANPAAEAA